MKDVNTLGWRGKPVRHTDGRTGVIAAENVGIWWCDLTIKVDNQDNTESITLNGRDPDFGATGWQWNYARPGEPEAWAFLGSHNTK
ncbi:hypothetical protein [Paraburkholderia sp. A3RO-2L]|jgi:hypothetical protein|uniref:hypothetical protein n=1 Tax=unclassified Paraburkholderia TaxID=2615204 RepID=UPI003DA7C304